MAIIAERLLGADRNALLRLLASMIGEFTIDGRGAFIARDLDGLFSANEAIHRLSGHMRDLTDPQEPFTESRAEVILACLAMLRPKTLARLEAHCPF